MRRLVRAWWGVWRRQPLRIRSSATPVGAAGVLAAARAVGGYWSVDTPDGRLGPLVVRGRVSVTGVRLAVGRFFRVGPGPGPTLRGRFVMASGGSELVGEIGYGQFGLAMAGLSFGACGLAALGGLIAVVRALVTGDWSAVPLSLAVTGGAIGVSVLHATVMAVAGLRRDRDDRFLRAWVTQRLASPSVPTSVPTNRRR